MRALLLAAAIAVASLAAACSGAFNTQSLPDPAESVQLPGPANAPPLATAAAAAAAAAPEPLPGVDTSSLSRRELELFGRMTQQLYAPCADQAVSLAQCVREHRACAACTPAVKLLADKIHEGANAEQAQAVYGLRFGPNVKPIQTNDAPAKGPANAPVTVVEWFDFECPHCKFAKPILDRLVDEHPGAVRLVAKFYPLHAHQRAEPAARAAIAAWDQGKFWEMEQLLFAHQAELQDADLARYAAELKLDPKRFEADMKSERTTEKIARDRAEADQLGLDGTPFIFIDGRLFDARLFHIDSDLEPWVDLELKLKGVASK
ncbi:MAG TPA: thioredoxin domain-containing protein [Minicystis sp.]|nr:thioredoxin domain-containing protein [Minicystis sp.]